LPKFNLAQDLEEKKAEPRTPHFLRLKQDIVVCSQEQKCGLKYVMQTSRENDGIFCISTINF
jgi:hypothetical protein